MKKLTKEEIIEQRKQFPRVLVSDDNHTWQERILLFQHENGCLVVCNKETKSFLNGEIFEPVTYTFWKPLPQKKQVPFEHGKEIDWDWKFRDKQSGFFCTVKGLGEEYIEFKLCKITLKKLFENYELSKDNGVTWQFAGKEIEEE